MRPEALSFLQCPNCGAELVLSGSTPREAEDGHVMAGGLTCRGCGSNFPIRNGVPVLLPANLAGVKLETAAGITEEWTRWSELRDYYEKEFFDWAAPRVLSGARESHSNSVSSKILGQGTQSFTHVCYSPDFWKMENSTPSDIPKLEEVNPFFPDCT